MQYNLKKIKGDASFREFYRLKKGRNTSIIIYSRKDTFKNLIQYASINKILLKNKILAPQLKKSYFSKGLMEVTDFGNNIFYDYIKKSKKKEYHYKKLINLILKLQKIKIKRKIKFKNYEIKLIDYNLKELQKESDLFFRWYLNFFFKCNKKVIKKIKSELKKIYLKLNLKNNILTHRDFHASNIIIFKNKFALIDSQDAIIGNPMYDLASLIDDVRIKIPNKLRSKLFEYYVLKSNFKKEDANKLMNDFEILSVQRNLKILGIFVRLFRRDKKSKYLKFLPNTCYLINKRMTNPIFKNLKQTLKKYIELKNLNKKLKNVN